MPCRAGTARARRATTGHSGQHSELLGSCYASMDTHRRGPARHVGSLCHRQAVPTWARHKAAVALRGDGWEADEGPGERVEEADGIVDLVA